MGARGSENDNGLIGIVPGAWIGIRPHFCLAKEHLSYVK